jgi:nitroreductase
MRSAAFVLVQADTVGPVACVQGGRAAQRVWLTATSLGLAAQPMMGMLCLLPYIQEPPTESGVTSSARLLISRAHKLLESRLPLSSDRQPILLLRVGRAPEPSATSLRREVRTTEPARQGSDQ